MSRPLRSLLFAPGNRPRMVAKVATFGSDAVILDLEDAVPLAEKEATRAIVRAALPTLAPGPLRFVRVNALETGWTRGDLEAVVCAELDGVKIPKLETADEAREVDRMLTEVERECGLPAHRSRWPRAPLDSSRRSTRSGSTCETTTASNRTPARPTGWVFKASRRF